MQIIGNGKLITRDEGAPYLENGAVAWQGGVIEDVGETSSLKANYPSAEFIDARGGVIMPGLINAHTHLFSALARGLPVFDYESKPILDNLWWNLERQMTLRRTRASVFAAIIECIKQGVTCVFDQHASCGGIDGTLLEIADVAKVLGMRACLCYEVSDRDGPDMANDAIRENAIFIRWAARQKSDMIKGMFGMHSPHTISDETFEACVEACGDVAGFHVHAGTNTEGDSLKKYGLKPFERLKKHGIFGDKTILVNCTHITPQEADHIAETDTMVVINPESAISSDAAASIRELQSRGVLLGVGSDVYTNDLLESIKIILAGFRHNSTNAAAGFTEMSAAVFSNNAKIAGRCFDIPLGVLKKGAAADIIVMGYMPFTPFSAENADAHILYGMSGHQCRTTVINGNVLMRDGELLNIDEEAVNARIREATQGLWSDMKE